MSDPGLPVVVLSLDSHVQPIVDILMVISKLQIVNSCLTISNECFIALFNFVQVSDTLP